MGRHTSERDVVSGSKHPDEAQVLARLVLPLPHTMDEVIFKCLLAELRLFRPRDGPGGLQCALPTTSIIGIAAEDHYVDASSDQNAQVW